MKHDVKVVKGIHGWKATTDVQLEGTRLLRVETSRHEIRGRAAGVSTRASVFKVDGNFLSCDLFGDYSKNVVVDTTVRCTEKSITLVHAASMAQLDAVLADVKSFYVAKDAKDAEQARKDKEYNEARTAARAAA